MRAAAKYAFITIVVMAIAGGGKILHDRARFLEARERLERIADLAVFHHSSHSDPRLEMSLRVLGLWEDCNEYDDDVFRRVDGMYHCRISAWEMLAVIRRDGSFPFYRSRAYLDLLDALYAATVRAAISRDRDRVFDVRRMLESVLRLIEIVDEIESRGLTDTALYDKAMRETRVRIDSTLWHIEREVFSSLGPVHFLSRIQCLRPENMDYDPENPFGNAGLLQYFGCMQQNASEVSERRKRLQEEQRQRAIKHCRREDYNPYVIASDTDFEELCAIRKELLSLRQAMNEREARRSP